VEEIRIDDIRVMFMRADEDAIPATQRRLKGVRGAR
jgi:hypothetical protein